MLLSPQFTHDCTADRLVAVVPGVADVYFNCNGGHTVREGNDGPDYSSSYRWTLADAFAHVRRYSVPNARRQARRQHLLTLFRRRAIRDQEARS